MPQGGFRVGDAAEQPPHLAEPVGVESRVQQAPADRIRWQADPEAVENWKTEDFPAIRAQATKEGATVYFADEAGLRSDYHAGTTWAPAGQTPIVKATGARHSLNMVSAVSAQGRLRFSTYTGSCTAERFIEFCEKLLHDADGPVYLIVDGHPTHKAKAVKKFVAKTERRYITT